MKEKIVNLSSIEHFKNKLLVLIPTKTSQLTNDSGFVIGSDLQTQVDEIKENINNLGESVADGKALIASAITNKGITCEADNSFADMAAAIEGIVAGGGNDEIEIVNKYFGNGTSISTENLICAISACFVISDENKRPDITFTDSTKHEIWNPMVDNQQWISEKKYIKTGIWLHNNFEKDTTTITINISASDFSRIGTFLIKKKIT